jgi:Skp family chaperone for outer membrane proteins
MNPSVKAVSAVAAVVLIGFFIAFAMRPAEDVAGDPPVVNIPQTVIELTAVTQALRSELTTVQAQVKTMREEIDAAKVKLAEKAAPAKKKR